MKASIELGKVHMPSVKIGTSKRPSNRQEFPGGFQTQPGPASYNQTFNLLRLTNPAFRFGTEKRDKTLHKMNNTTLTVEPGPGAYQHREVLGREGPKYAIPAATRSTSSLEREAIPGPGHYSNMREMNQSTSSLLPGVTIGTSKRNKTCLEEIPGPQSYKPDDGFTRHGSIHWA